MSSVMVTASIMALELYKHQKIAMGQLKTGSILRGGVGSGKSRTALAYYYFKVCGGSIEISVDGVVEGDYHPMTTPRDLYIITTARKRDTLDWLEEGIPFMIGSNPELNESNVKLTIDSWNNIQKYCNVVGAFFIFDEQRAIGSGVWSKSFIQICKKNQWILLSATPGDTWMEYVPVFIANGFYKNRTEFCREHVIYNRFAKYPKVDRYIGVSKLIALRNRIQIDMNYIKPTTPHHDYIHVPYDKDLFKTIWEDRWNPFDDEPINNTAQLSFLMRKATSIHPARAEAVKDKLYECGRLIVFYTYDYELDILRQIGKETDIYTAEWNGHKHMPIPNTNEWLYLVQYTAGAEGWNCVETNHMLFYSENPSYKIMTQAAGRTDRLNTPYSDLFYHHIRSDSPSDKAIAKILERKEEFNEGRFIDYIKASQEKHRI